MGFANIFWTRGNYDIFDKLVGLKIFSIDVVASRCIRRLATYVPVGLKIPWATFNGPQDVSDDWSWQTQSPTQGTPSHISRTISDLGVGQVIELWGSQEETA